MPDTVKNRGAFSEPPIGEFDNCDALAVITEEKIAASREILSSRPKSLIQRMSRFLQYGRVNPYFDPVWYMAFYDDVRESAQDPWEHYSRFGLKEGRQPNPFFAPEWYLTENPDVVSTGMDPLRHYARFGASEGRDPHPLFSTSGYLAKNHDVKALGMNPLLHFIRFGAQEGRVPVSVDTARGIGALPEAAGEEPEVTYVDAYDADGAFQFEGFISPFTLPDFPVEKIDIRKVPRLPASVPPLCIILSASNRASSLRLIRVLNAFIRPQDSIFVLAETHPDYDQERIRCASIEEFCRPDFADTVILNDGYVVFLSDDQKIDFNVLLKLIMRMQSSGRTFGYGDECYSDGKRAGPFYKPDWDPALLLQQDYIGRAAVIDVAHAKSLGWFRREWAPYFADRFALRHFEALNETHVEHVAEILAVSPYEHQDGVLRDTRIRKALVAASATVRDIRAFIKQPPKTEIIIPTRDGYDILKTCIDSIFQKTRFRGEYSIAIVNNQSKDLKTLDYLEKCRAQGIRIIDFDEPFNYSKMNNVAAASSTAECLVFLNNDIEVISSGWLQRLIAVACLPDVGAVGAKLLYPDTRVQHGGVVLGPGHSAMHVLRLSQQDEPGYAWQLARSRSYLAVTAACLAVRRAKFLEVGGFDEVNLPVAYNDVDLCLKLYMNGYSNIWLPSVKLYHHESISRGADTTLEKRRRAEGELRYMWRTWSALYARDPFHNTNILYSWGPNVAVRTASYE